LGLKILSYNICNGGGDRLPLIASLIQSRRPDLVALQEATDRSKAESLANMLEMELAFGEAGSGFHLAWLSRLPVVRWENHRLPALTRALLEIEVVWKGTALSLFTTHLWPRGSVEGERRRIEEVQAILGVLRPLGDRPHLLLGDFNALSPGDPIGTPHVEREGAQVRDLPRWIISMLLDAGYVDCYRAQHPSEPGYTFAPFHPWARIDYIFASSALAIRLLACEVATGAETREASDHFPVWAEFDEEG
jgi:endonuclease/exonuclease/phosphatase family metal-dependent hydrolase